MEPTTALTKVLPKKDNMIVRLYRKWLKSLYFRKYTLWDVRPKARLSSYSLIGGLCLLSFSLLIVRPSELHASQVIDLSAIAQIESSNNPNAFNPASKATGLYQITPICLKDFILNARRGTFKLSDMKDPAKAKIVASWYFSERLPGLIQHLGEEVTEDTLLIGYNCGPGCLKRSIPLETKNYLKKYKELTL